MEAIERQDERLLEPGWAGEANDAEARYIAEELSKSAKLRQVWGVRRYFGKRWKHISPAMAKRLCQAWARNSPTGAEGASTASDKKAEGSGNTKVPSRQLVLL